MARKIPIQGVLYINGKPVENTFNKLYGTTRKLERELKKLKTGTEAWQQKAMEVKKASAAFESVRKEINAVRQSAQSSGNALIRFFKRLGNSMISVFTGFSLSTLVTGLFNKLGDYTGDLLRL